MLAVKDLKLHSLGRALEIVLYDSEKASHTIIEISHFFLHGCHTMKKSELLLYVCMFLQHIGMEGLMLI